MTAPTATIRVRRLTQSPKLRDLLVALTAFGLTLALLHGVHGARRQLDPLGGALAALACFPLLARRRSRSRCSHSRRAASASLKGLGYALGPPFGPTVALFFVATDERTRTRIRQTAVVVLGMFAIHVGSTLIAHHGFPTSPILFGVVVWGGAWDEQTGIFVPHSVNVLTLRGAEIEEITAFLTPDAFAHFGLPDLIRG